MSAFTVSDLLIFEEYGGVYPLGERTCEAIQAMICRSPLKAFLILANGYPALAVDILRNQGVK